MIPADMLEKYGRPTILITVAIVVASWLAGYWRNWSDLNFKFLYLLLGAVILVVAFVSWIWRLARRLVSTAPGTQVKAKLPKSGDAE